MRGSSYRIVTLVFVLALALGAAGPASAAPLAAFTIEPTAQSTLWVDANKCNAEGPRGAWLSFIVTNTSGVEQSDVTITFSGFTGANAAYFTATQDPLRQVGTLGAGESTVAYFYVDYAEVCNHPHSGGTTYDGYTANYAVTAAGSFGSTAYAGTVVTDELLNAAAAGVVVSNVIGPAAYTGQIVTQAVTYSFGNNNDLFFQPSIEAGFNDTCWRLVDSKITAVSAGVTGVTVGEHNRLWFPNASASATDNTIEVTYYWESLCTEVGQIVTPWAAAKSGNNYKYSGASGANLLPQAGQAVSATKTGPACVNEADKYAPVTYTVTFSNSATNGPVILSSITDALPSCMKILQSATEASDVTAANSSSVPAAGAQGTVAWVGKYRGADPATTYQIPAAGPSDPGALTLEFTVDISACAFGTDTEPERYTNLAAGKVGNLTVSAPGAIVHLPCSPAAVRLDSMTAAAEPDQGRIVLTWLTASEIDVLGFNLYRSSSPAAKPARLNGQLIAAAAPGASDGARYVFIDQADLQPGTTYTYWLEDIGLDGAATRHAPVSTDYGPVRVRRGWLPLVE